MAWLIDYYCIKKLLCFVTLLLCHYIYNMVLITGATGLVGSHLLLHLLESSNAGGKKVRAIYRKDTSVTRTRSLFALYGKEHLFPEIEWVNADITDIPSLETAFRNVTEVYHCAANISFDPADEEKLRKTNIEGTANIVNFCLAFSVRKLCHVSSIAALGDLKEYETIVTETTEWNPEKPHSDYAITKFGAEMEIWRGFQEGLAVVIVNPGVILGAYPDAGGWKTGSGDIFNRVANRLPFYTKGATGFVSVSDVVKIMVLLMNSNTNGERYIVISENMTFESILKKTAVALKVKPPFLEAKKWMTSVSWRIDWFLSALFFQKRTMSKAMAHALHTADFISNEKITKETSYQFEKIETVIPNVASFYKK